MNEPQISILTPTWNRNKWIPLMIHNLTNLDYDKNKLEWCILDDGTEKMFNSIEDIKNLEEKIKIKINYQYKNTRLTIGHKRNLLTKMAKYKICANMDTDDIFFPTWLKHSISVMNSDKRCSLVGTKAMLFCYPDEDFNITKIDCKKKRMIHESGMLYTKKHHKMMGGFKKGNAGEGTSMIDSNEKMCLCSRVEDVIICIAHSENTVKKDTFRDKEVGLSLDGELKDLIKSILPDIKQYTKPKINLTRNHFFRNFN